ncbi:hypothetical protein SBA1_780017 [Candidatus Sulfotelmatobacter kueseliae]|uniref:Uncharacterized protein n=1 Tax=Candidatus Sulfotelmatobacter kueseliae TaxID=2042962 RepID=A0A2U3L7D9_9BACT|nr:hypothetical protein SBA1_780017 [Candidatus Sulfotelmatobacter kueseliae]
MKDTGREVTKAQDPELTFEEGLIGAKRAAQKVALVTSGLKPSQKRGALSQR